MKLFTRYSRINVMTTIIIFLISSVAYYFLLQYILVNQVDEDLRIEEKEIRSFVTEHGTLPEAISLKDQSITYKAISTPLNSHHYVTKNVSTGEKVEKYRQLTFGILAGRQWYHVFVAKALAETNNLLQTILAVTTLTILLILLTSFIINRVVVKQLWKPFYHTMDSVKNFTVDGRQPVHFKPTPIEEFAFMNNTLHRITDQAQADYKALKTFSENASHEIQTPLAVIRSKLDLLIMDEGLTQTQSMALQRAYDAVQKLSKLNQSLLLLAKIENRQYTTTILLSLKEKLQEKINDFQELWQAQQISWKASLQPTTLNMNENLADILLNNLLSNATRHNHPGGSIDITLRDKELTISNSSHQPALPPHQLFQRFYKPESANENNGLGLSIIKQICDVSGIAITYHFQEQHQFILRW